MNNTENKGFGVHVFSTSYPLPKTKLKKAVNEAQKNYELALKLWK